MGIHDVNYNLAGGFLRSKRKKGFALGEALQIGREFAN
jgi:hypothetical protein